MADLTSTELSIAAFVAVLIIGTVLSKLQGRAAAHTIKAMHGGDLRQLTEAMLKRTGYQHAHLRGAPLGTQLDHSMQQLGATTQRTHLVRNQRGLELHFQQSAREAGGGGSRQSARWWTPARAQFGLHIADQRLCSLNQKLNNVFTNLVREFRPRHPTEIPLPGPLSGRFRAWTTDPNRAQAALDDPALQAALLTLPLVDLATLDRQISFSDPLLETLRPPPGVRRADATVQAHNAVELLLTETRRVTAAADTSAETRADGCPH
jgi:hypothetical protein